MEMLAIMIYVGGLVAAPDGWGFWRTATWPVALGETLVGWIVRSETP